MACFGLELRRSQNRSLVTIVSLLAVRRSLMPTVSKCLRPMTHYPETGTRKPVLISCRFVMQFDTDFFRYQNVVRVRALLYSVKETGTGFLVPVFGTGFWIVCHGP